MAYQKDSKTPNRDKIVPGFFYTVDGLINISTGWGGALNLYDEFIKAGFDDASAGDAVLMQVSRGKNYALSQISWPDPENEPMRLQHTGEPVKMVGMNSFTEADGKILDQLLRERFGKLPLVLGHEKTPPESDGA